MMMRSLLFQMVGEIGWPGEDVDAVAVCYNYTKNIYRQF